MIVPNAPVLPVTVAPETLVVNVPETPVTFEASNVLPVIVAPDTCVVNTPETPETVENCAVVPVTVVPDNVPLTRTPLANCASPVTVSPLATDKFPLTSRIGVPRTWNVPVVAATVVPVNVVPVTLVNVPFVKKALTPLVVVPVRLVKFPVGKDAVAPVARVVKVPVTALT